MLGKRSVFLGISLAAFVVAGIVADLQGADSRHLMNLQGRLTDTAGNPTSGDHLFELRIFNADTAGTQLYYEAQISTVNSGIYNILVGNGNAAFSGTSPADYAVSGASTGGIPQSVFDREDVWLEVEVDQDNPLRPRTKIVSSAYSFRALKADSLSSTGGGSAIQISGPTIRDAQGGAAMRRAATTTASSTNMSGDIYSVSFTKTDNASQLRFTYSDTFTRRVETAVTCAWTISVAGATVCTFTYEGVQNDTTGAVTSANSGLTSTAGSSAFSTAGSGTLTSNNATAGSGTDGGGTQNRSTTDNTNASGHGDWHWWGSGNWTTYDHTHSHTMTHYHSMGGTNHNHTISDHSHSVGSHSHSVSEHTHSVTRTVKDTFSRRVPITRVCAQNGIPAGPLTAKVTGSGGSNCGAGDGGILLVDEVF